MKQHVEEGRAFDERMRAAIEKSQAEARRVGFIEPDASLADAKKMLPRGHLTSGHEGPREVDPESTVNAAIGFRDRYDEDLDPGVLSAQRRKFLAR